MSLVFGLGLEHSCPWPRECLSSERLSLALASDFFVSLALASSLVSSTPPLVISTGTIFNTCIYQPQSVTSKLLIIQGHIKMRDDVLYKCVIDECTISCHSSNRIGYC